jgi:hypothetical protein
MGIERIYTFMKLDLRREEKLNMWTDATISVNPHRYTEIPVVYHYKEASIVYASNGIAEYWLLFVFKILNECVRESTSIKS